MTSQDFPGAPTLYSMPCVMGLNYSHAVFTVHMEKFFLGGGLEKLGYLPDHSSLLHQPCCIFFHNTGSHIWLRVSYTIPLLSLPVCNHEEFILRYNIALSGYGVKGNLC